MPVYINTNISSIIAQRSLGTNTTALNKSLERLSTGFRINRSGDDAAGLQISELLRVQIRGSHKAYDNVQDGINVLNIADGAYETVTSNLQRIRELVVQGASDTNGTDQRNAIKSELDQLSSEIDRIINTTRFNGITLLNGSQTTFFLQVGTNGTSNDHIDVGAVFANNLTNNLEVDTSNLTVDNATNAQLTLNKIDSAIGTLVVRRATIGAFVNRLEAAGSNLQIGIENQSAAESRIRNVDVAQESSRMISNQILQQAASSILSQANQLPSLALRLLQQG
jgi:flagellin